MNAAKQLSVLNQVMEGEVSILLITPEGLMKRASPSSTHPLHRLPISFVCIDEVHCIPEWSYYIRPSYLRVCKVLRELGIDRILGLTATATRSTISSLVKCLGIDEKKDVICPCFRIPKNIHISVSHETDRDEALLQLLKVHKTESMKQIIIYCETKNHVDHVQHLINCRGLANAYPSPANGHTEISWKVGRYHSAVPPEERESVQQKFTVGELEIVVATVSLGMGLNFPAVRATIHYSLPKSLERFVQAITRAGRDGHYASCHVLIGKEGDDVKRASYLIQQNTPDVLTTNNFVGLVAEYPSTKKIDGVAEVKLTRTDIDRICKTLKISRECFQTLLCLIESQDFVVITSLSSMNITFKRRDFNQLNPMYLGKKLNEKLGKVEKSQLEKLEMVDEVLRDVSQANFQECSVQSDGDAVQRITKYFLDAKHLPSKESTEYEAQTQQLQRSKPTPGVPTLNRPSKSSHGHWQQSVYQSKESSEETDTTISVLDEGDQFEITTYLANLDRVTVYHLGQALGLKQSKVKEMKNSETFLDDVIAAWLRREDYVDKQGKPTWMTLVKALRHQRIEQHGVANDISKDKGL